VLGRLKDREQGAILSKAGLRSAEIASILEFAEAALESQKELVGRKINTPIEAYRFLERLPLDQTAYLLAESRNSAALSKIRAYLNKWRPMRSSLPVVATELEAIGMPRGQKFEEVVEQVFAAQLTGRGKTPEERQKMLRKFSGIKEPPKEKKKEKKVAKVADKDQSAQAAKAQSKATHKEALGKHAANSAAKSAATASAHAKTAAAQKKSRGRK
jgi:hypothetical protein